MLEQKDLEAIRTIVKEEVRDVVDPQFQHVNELIEINAQAILENREAIGQNREAILENHKAIGQNREAILENREAIGQNREAILENHKAIGQNREAILENHKAIGQNREVIQDNAEAIHSLADHLDRRFNEFQMVMASKDYVTQRVARLRLQT